MKSIIINSLKNLGARRILYIVTPIFITSIIETLSIGSLIPIFYYKKECIDYLSDSNIFKINHFEVISYINNNYIVIALVILLLLVGIKIAAGTWSNARLYKLVFELQKNISTNVLKKNIESEYGESIKISSAELIKQSINDATVYCHMNLIQIGLLFSDSILIFLIASTIFIYDWKSALFLTFFNLIFSYFIYTKLKNKSVFWGEVRAQNEKARIANIQSIKNGEREIRSLNTTKFFLDHYRNINEKIANSTKNQFLLNYLPRQLIELSAIISIIFVVIKLKFDNYSDQNILIILVGLAAMQSRLMPAISRALVSLQNIAYSEPIAHLITKDMLSTPSIESVRKTLFAKNVNSIYLDKLSIMNSNKTIISNLTYHFEKNNIYCITGKSGRGKSTLLNTIAGFNNKYTGSIGYEFCDGILINNINLLSFVFLTQKPFTYEASLLDNITLGVHINSELYKDIAEAAAQLELNNRINFNELEKEFFPENYSGGENQRLSLLRCALNLSDVILLDEPTSALDNNSEKLFMKFLEKIKLNKIIIIVSHSSYVINGSDFILDLDK